MLSFKLCGASFEKLSTPEHVKSNFPELSLYEPKLTGLSISLAEIWGHGPSWESNSLLLNDLGKCRVPKESYRSSGSEVTHPCLKQQKPLFK